MKEQKPYKTPRSLKPLWYSLSFAASFVAVSGIAVGAVYLDYFLNNQEEVDITAPDGTILNSEWRSINFVAFVRHNNDNPTVHWYYDNIPYEYIDIQQFDNTIELNLLRDDFTETYHFDIWAKDLNDGKNIQSNKITATLSPTAQSVHLSFNGNDTLSSQNDVVSINATFAINTPTDTIWEYELPNPYVEEISQSNSSIAFRSTLDMPSNIKFPVYAKRDGAQDVLYINIKKPTTIIDLSYGVDSNNNTNTTLSFKNTSVKVIANVQHQNMQPITWTYTLPSDLLPIGAQQNIKISNTSSSITFTMLENMPSTVMANSFILHCQCNGVTTSTPVYLERIDSSANASIWLDLKSVEPTQQDITADGIIYQSGQFINGASSIKCPAWKAGALIYQPTIYNDNGNVINIDPNKLDYDAQASFNNPALFNFEEIDAGPDRGAIKISWPAGAWDLNIYQTCVLKFNVDYTPDPGDPDFSGAIQSLVILNIDFGNLTGVQFTSQNPDVVRSVNGTLTYSGQAVGEGIMDDRYYKLNWSLDQLDGPTPPSSFNISSIMAGHNDTDFVVRWTYEGLEDLTINYRIKLTSETDPNFTASRILTIVLRATNSVEIVAPAKVDTNINTAGQTVLKSIYNGESPSTNTSWSIVDYGGANPLGFSFSPAVGKDTSLIWTSDAFPLAQDYEITVRATNVDNPTITSDTTIVFHNRGNPTDIQITGGETIGGVSTNVQGENVDQGVTFSLRETGSSGQPTVVKLTNVTKTSCDISAEYVNYGKGSVSWVLTITTKDNGGIPIIRTVSGSYSWSNYYS